jgi:F-box/leucine-rich repeat protein 2/20
MEDLPEELLAEIVKRVTRLSDWNSLSLVSKLMYKIEGDQRITIRVSYNSLCPSTEALASLCSRFSNLCKVDIDYCGWVPGHGNQLDNKGLFVLSSCCPSLTDLTLSYCSYIDDSGLGCLAHCKKLMTLRLNRSPEITSRGLLSVAVGCKSLSALHLIKCKKIGNTEWLEYFGLNGSLEELIVKKCTGIRQCDFLKFGPGWMKLQKFEFEKKGGFWPFDRTMGECYDPSYNAHKTNLYDFCCESLKDLRLAHVETWPETGLRFILGKCKSLEKICLEYVHALNDNDMIALSRSCDNLKSISLWLKPAFYKNDYTTPFTDVSLNALALNCPVLQTVELTFACCSEDCPEEIGFTQKGLVVLIQSCPIRVLMLNGANFLDDEGMKALSSAPFLETLELVDCTAVTDSGMHFITHTPRLSNLTLRCCHSVTDVGVSELVQGHKFESLIIEGCPQVSLEAVQGAAGVVKYSVQAAPRCALKRLYY